MYTFHIDPGHGWLQVPVQEVINSGIRVSTFSYTDGEFVYLEEDCDAPRFTKAVGHLHTETQHHGNDCFIRNLDRFSQAPGHTYFGVVEEDTTEYLFHHQGSYIDDETATAAFELGLQEAEEARADAGGFGLRPIALYCITPIMRIVQWYDQDNEPEMYAMPDEN